MASSKRRPSKQKRSKQNRQERAIREARSARAGEATAISRGERAPTSTPAASAANTPKLTPKQRRAKARASTFTIPGQRAVVMAFLFTLVSAATLLFAPIQVQRDVQPDDPRVVDESPELNEDGTVTIDEDAKLAEEESLPVAAAVLGVPILICGAAVAMTKRPQRSTAWTMAMIALSAYIFLFAGPYGVISLPSLIALAVAGFQSRRAEGKERLATIRAEKAAAEAAGDESR